MRARVVEGLRHLGIGALAGVLVGIVVGGLGGRLVMRVSGFLNAPEFAGQTTENGNCVGVVTLSGTLPVVVFSGLFPGLLGGWVYAGMRPALAWAGRWRGMLFGGVVLALGGSVIIDPDNFDFRRFGPATLNVAMFAALCSSCSEPRSNPFTRGSMELHTQTAVASHRAPSPYSCGSR